MGNQHGFTIIKTMIIVALFSIILYGFTDYFLYLQKSTTAQINKEKRASSKFQLERLLLSTFAIRSSSYATENSLLRACAFSETTTGCTGTKCCPHDTEFSISLVDISTDISATDKAGRIAELQKAPRLSGPAQKPILYSAQGLPNCKEDCAYSVSTTAKAHCPGNEATCMHAEHIDIELQINPLGSYGFLQKKVTQRLIYYVNRNYPPSFTPPTNILVGESFDSVQSVNANSGHPSERQSFAFTTCESSDTAIATINCDDGFTGLIGYFKVIGVSKGNTQVTLKISDGQSENSLSESMTIPVVVY